MRLLTGLPHDRDRALPAGGKIANSSHRPNLSYKRCRPGRRTGAGDYPIPDELRINGGSYVSTAILNYSVPWECAGPSTVVAANRLAYPKTAFFASMDTFKNSSISRICRPRKGDRGYGATTADTSRGPPRPRMRLPSPYPRLSPRHNGRCDLCLGAHADDIEIGCGGTILTLLAARRNVDFHWVVFSGGGDTREREARKSADLFLARAKRQQLTVHGFRDCFFPYLGGEIKETFEALAREGSPDVVFTHARHDRHQDHRLISDLTWNTFRRHLILEYEVPKYDGDLGVPNFFVPLTSAVARAKIRHLRSAFGSQRTKQWFTADTFHGLLRLRGANRELRRGWPRRSTRARPLEALGGRADGQITLIPVCSDQKYPKGKSHRWLLRPFSQT